ncbi:MAG: 4Fe-4S binding protein [Candidatus Aminicenantes bacterium]|jgi:NAD-dependent dihydropyrimidine dehydrogenase PreA subunit
MKIFKLSLPILSCILLAAHFSRVQNDWFAAACLVFPFILLSKKEWVMRIFQVFLLFGGVIWIERTLFLVRMRQRIGESWVRLVIILGVVALFTILSAAVFNNKKIQAIFKKGVAPPTHSRSARCRSFGGVISKVCRKNKVSEGISKKGFPGSTLPAVISCLVTAVILSIVQMKVKTPVILLLERFQPGAGWVEVMLLALYAGWITEKLIDPQKTPLVRSRIWTLFSIVFFTQLLLGLAGLEKMLMTGKLHLPVPALIIAGPLFRGEGFFMLILFGATILLVGPAWCSYLCYIGAWDNLAAREKKIPGSLPPWRHAVRIGILLLVLIAAILLRMLGVPGLLAVILAAVFGLLGVAIMVFFSRKSGAMAHCITYCPIGLVANWLGRISPFRLRITDSCTECGACRLACRYEALNVADIEKRKPGLTCTLCGDCITRCKENALEYKFLKMKPTTARYFFIVTAASLHAIFLGAARL